jgi:predicted GNAT family N-acyltransferase
MVDQRQHRQGAGRFLLLARLQEIAQTPGIEMVKLNTSQHTFGFFAKVGFVVERIKEDHFALGLHEYNMSLTLDDERKRLIAAQLMLAARPNH